MKPVSRFFKRLHQCLELQLEPEKTNESLRPEQESDSPLTLKGSSDSKQKRKTEGGEKTGASSAENSPSNSWGLFLERVHNTHHATRVESKSRVCSKELPGEDTGTN